jgi:hypothetical protein
MITDLTAEGRAYDIAARLSAHIVNILADHDGCKALLFGKVLFACLDAIKEAERSRVNPYERSEN